MAKIRYSPDKAPIKKGIMAVLYEDFAIYLINEESDLIMENSTLHGASFAPIMAAGRIYRGNLFGRQQDVAPLTLHPKLRDKFQTHRDLVSRYWRNKRQVERAVSLMLLEVENAVDVQELFGPQIAAQIPASLSVLEGYPLSEDAIQRIKDTHQVELALIEEQLINNSLMQGKFNGN